MKHLIPQLRIVKGELPQWIISSSRAAYHPASRTIWLTRRPRHEMALDFAHEVGHHVIEVLTGSPKIQHAYDRVYAWAQSSMAQWLRSRKH
jgi:hypothetical protein